jgi:hypothetical protein
MTLVVVIGGLVGLLWLVYRLPATVGALVAGGVGFLASKFYESLKESKQRLHDKKREVYAKLLAPILALHLEMLKPNKEQPAHEVVLAQMTTQMVEATFDSVLYASDEVLKLWARIRTSSLQNLEPGVILVLYMRLLKAMRKDVGNTYTSLTEADILMLFVNFTDDDFQSFFESVARTK